MKIYNNTLTDKSVSIQSNEYGMRVYVNSTRGRAQLESECSADIVKAVYAVWGDNPTVIEPTPPTPPAPQPSETDKIRQQLAYVQSAFAAMQASS